MRKILFCLSICLLLVGCSFGIKEKDNNPEPEKEFPLEGTINGYSYKISSVDMDGNRKKTERGYYIDTLNQPNAPYYYFITSGEKNTGGYSIKVKSMDVDNEGNAKVIVIEENPPKDAIVTMAFTYPTVVIEVNKAFKSIKIENTSGIEFQEIK